MYIILYLLFAGQLLERMVKRPILRTVTGSNKQHLLVLYTKNNYHHVIFINYPFHVQTFMTISHLTGFSKKQTFLNKFQKDDDWDNCFVVPSGCPFVADHRAKVHRMCGPHASDVYHARPPRRGEGYCELQVIRNVRGLGILPLVEAAYQHLQSYLVLSKPRHCDNRLTV